jgi:hypothetical protein
LSKEFSTKGNLTETSLKLANSLGIILRSSQWSDKFSWRDGLISVKLVLNNSKEYKKAIPSLRGKDIMYVDQVLNRELNSILSWSFIQLLNNANRESKPS